MQISKVFEQIFKRKLPSNDYQPYASTRHKVGTLSLSDSTNDSNLSETDHRGRPSISLAP